MARITTLPWWRMMSRSLGRPPGSISLSCTTRKSGPSKTVSELIICSCSSTAGLSALEAFFALGFAAFLAFDFLTFAALGFLAFAAFFALGFAAVVALDLAALVSSGAAAFAALSFLGMFFSLLQGRWERIPGSCAIS